MSYSKYRSQKCVVDGIKFDSKREAARYCELRLLERAGIITDLKLQVPFIILHKNANGREIKYVADFTYTEGNKQVVEDSKGFKTPVYKLKKRLLAEMGIVIKETN